jgi:hypothetical protein
MHDKASGAHCFSGDRPGGGTIPAIKRNRFFMPDNTDSPVWTACLAAFAHELTPQQFATWIRPLACEATGQTLTLTAPNRFVLQWV